MQKLPDMVSFPSNGTARPIRFAYRDENGIFNMNLEAINALKQVDGPIAVVSVYGLAEKVKYFILNQLLFKSGGSQVPAEHWPSTEGLWMWSAPMKRTTLDGTEYSLLLLDTAGVDASDQTGTYSTQIFSLAVLLSSMFIYNQMGGIDETALDRLSVVTEITKDISVRASLAEDAVSGLGQFIPIFVWLLRDFHLDLTEDNATITPHDYLELALRRVPGSGKDIAAKNQIRESIRALFPDQECFSLNHPSNNKIERPHVEQFSLETFQPKFRYGVDALIKFVFERTRPKQVGGTIMTGPILAGVINSFLDALNNGAVSRISSSLQNVEEAQCQRAYDIATGVYMSVFDRTTPPEEVSLRDAHDAAVQESVVAFNTNAVGAGSVKQRYEVLLNNFFTRSFKDHRRSVLMEADLKCLSAVQNMENKLRAACCDPDAKVDDVVRVLDDLLSEYEASVRGPTKWKVLSSFLQKSLQDIVLIKTKKQIDQILSEKSTLAAKCCSIEDKMELLNKQLEASEKQKTAYQKHSENAIDDINKLGGHYLSRISDLESKCSSLEEKHSRWVQSMDSMRQECLEWKKRYEELLAKKNADDYKVKTEIAVLQGRSGKAEAKNATAKEKVQSAQKEVNEWENKYDVFVREANAEIIDLKSRSEAAEAKAVAANEKALSAQKEANSWKERYDVAVREANAEIAVLKSKSEATEAKYADINENVVLARMEANEWKDKYDAAVREARSALQKAVTVQERSNALRVEFSSSLAGKEEEIKDKVAKLVSAEQRLTTLTLELKAAESKIQSQDLELSDLKHQVRELSEKHEVSKAAADSLKSEIDLLIEEKTQIEQKYLSEKKLSQEIHERCRVAIEEAKMANEFADKAQTEVFAAQNERTDFQQLALGRLAQVETAQKHIESLERQNADIKGEIEKYRLSSKDAASKVASLEAKIKERQEEIKLLQKINNEKMLSSAEVLRSDLESEYAAGAVVKDVGGASSMLAELSQGNVDLLQQVWTSSFLDESTQNSESKSISEGKRSRLIAGEGSFMAQDMDFDEALDRESKRARGTMMPHKCTTESESSKGDSEDYTKFTVVRLRQELAKHGFGSTLVGLRSPRKKDILALYKKHVLQDE